MKIRLIILAACLAVLAGCNSGGAGGGGGQQAPDFQLQELSGGTVSLSGLKGKVVLVDFWATWCPPCRAEIPNLVALNEQYHAQGLEVIGVSMDQQGDEVVSKFVGDYKMTYHVGRDGNGAIAGLFGGVQAIPTAFLIGRDGAIITKDVGYKSKEELEAGITKALAEKGSQP